MDINRTHYNRCSVVWANGRIDTNTAPDLEKAFKEVINENKANIVFDMDEVNFISSRGIWVILETQKACKREDGDFVIAQANEDIKKSLDLAGVQHFVHMYDDLIEAVGSF
ncbi:MAG: anti-sigma factor antagonist [Aliifodinibius sp.]|nr:STAS domain-containing protein [candidate division Zixibacteria bacterium]NIT57383.1 STAS domain-containing protein [Fodinibius sp.]NIW45171.1 anti-sigma factor antagonist [Gammaproteobacteria bacterium]NIR64304.1 STAS domain-containing protein [candidate division Zixibacteria bacterium]NIS46207.1 STAS domain-containing protein [candidate division Zixibacteria bacterium]